MRRPPFKITHQHGCQVRYTDHRGVIKTRSGRRSFLVNRVWLWNIAVRDYGTDYAFRLNDGPWHPVHATQSEARALFEANPGPGQRLPWL